VYSSSQALCISEVQFCFFQSAMMKIVIRETGMDAVVNRRRLEDPCGHRRSQGCQYLCFRKDSVPFL